jgi:hypothetical protein
VLLFCRYGNQIMQSRNLESLQIVATFSLLVIYRGSLNQVATRCRNDDQ